MFVHTTLPFTHDELKASGALARDVLHTLFDNDRQLLESAMLRLMNGDLPRFPKWWNAADAGSIAAGMSILQCLVPVYATPQALVNFWTTMVVGYCLARLSIGFAHLDWMQFWTWVGLGLLACFIILKVRQVLARAG